ncbi:FadR/GntR family transcriptional regulator [Pelagibius sp. CAU 1746]|uniref:FadR/GntR family transcriptional regulator n=1 Tax=Pelagibius sp. CAU 1746 TaxID=3140370 RepID=UPI00325A89EA
MSVREEARKAAQKLRDSIEGHIREGGWTIGTQLPNERELAQDYGVSRNTVRRLLAKMEAEGWIRRQVGRGTFVKSIPGSAGEAQIDAKSINPAEVMEARLLIEPLLARLVVLRASERELEAIQAILNNGGRSKSMAEFEHWDNQLHLAIAHASKNQYLIGILEGIYRARQSQAWSGLRRKGLTDERRRVYHQHHERIVEALVARDGEAASAAIAEHLSRVQSNLLF